MQNNLSPKEQEMRFRKALEEDDWDEIWLRVYEACKASAKKKLKVRLDDDLFQNRLLDAVEIVINNVKNNNIYGTLITTAHYATLSTFFGPKAQREDKEQSWEILQENRIEVPSYDKHDEINGIEINNKIYWEDEINDNKRNIS